MAPQQDRRHLPSIRSAVCMATVSQPRPLPPANQDTNRGGWMVDGGRDSQSPTCSGTRSPPTLERTWTMLHVSPPLHRTGTGTGTGLTAFAQRRRLPPPSRLPPFRYPARTATACETGLAGRRESTWTRAVCMRTLPVVACRWRWDVFAPKEEKKEVLQCAANATAPGSDGRMAGRG